MAFVAVGSGKTTSAGIGSGDFVTVTSGGSAVGVTVAGGFLTVGAGGSATATVLQNGTIMTNSGGVTSGTTVQSGFSEVFSGGTDVGTVVNSGGFEQVYAGGTARNLVVHSGGFATIGGTVNGITVDRNASLVLYPTASVTKADITAGGSLDFSYLPYIAGGTATLDPATDLLTISGGGMTETVQLAGDYTDKVFSTSTDSALLTFGKGTPGTQISVSAMEQNVSNSVSISGNNNVVRLTGGTISFAAGTSGNSAVLGYGAVTVQDNGSNTTYGGQGAGTVTGGAGSSLVVGGAGRMTYTAGSGTSTVFAGAGGLTFTGGSGYATVVGLGHAMTVQGGTGGGVYFGGGNGFIRAGGDTAQSILVGAGGDRLATYGAAGALFGAGATGDMVMDASADTGSNVFFGAAGHGQLTFITGSGNDVLGLGQGTNLVTLGAGHSTVLANTGSTGVSRIGVGTGSADIGLGGASVNVVLSPVSAPHDVALYNFVPGADVITLSGYGAGTAANAVSSQAVVNGSTVLHLGDGTGVTLIGISTAVDTSIFR